MTKLKREDWNPGFCEGGEAEFLPYQERVDQIRREHVNHENDPWLYQAVVDLLNAYDGMQRRMGTYRHRFNALWDSSGGAHSDTAGAGEAERDERVEEIRRKYETAHIELASEGLPLSIEHDDILYLLSLPLFNREKRTGISEAQLDQQEQEVRRRDKVFRDAHYERKSILTQGDRDRDYLLAKLDEAREQCGIEEAKVEYLKGRLEKARSERNDFRQQLEAAKGREENLKAELAASKRNRLAVRAENEKLKARVEELEQEK